MLFCTPNLRLVLAFGAATSLFMLLQSEPEAGVVNENPLSAHGRLSPNHLAPGANAQLTLDLSLAEPHHAYLDKFKLKIKSPPGTLHSQPEITPIVEFDDRFSKSRKKGVRGDALLKSVVEIPEDIPRSTSELVAELSYQACTTEYCLFPKTISVSIPFTLEVEGSPPKAFSFLNPQELSVALKSNFFLALFISFVAGFLTSLTPCVYPMIPITLTVLGARRKDQSRIRSFLLSLSYVFGIALSYSALGLFAAYSGMLFGSLLGHPIVVGLMAIVFILMGLSLLGFFEIRAPAFVQNRLSSLKHVGLWGAFLAGLAAGVIASPCVGPVLVGILTFIAEKRDLFLGFWLLFSFSLGLGILFLVLGTFGHLIQRLPRSGRWLMAVKFLLALAMFFMAAYYVSPLLGFSGFRQTQPLKLESSPIPWRNYSESALEDARAKSQPVILDFYADWCAACKELEAHTFSSPEVQSYAQDKNFMWLKFDATQGSEELEQLKVKYQILGLPHVVFFDSSGIQKADLTLNAFEEAPHFLRRLKETAKHY